MDQKTESIFTYILYLSLTVVLLYVLLQNLSNPWLILILSGLVIASVTVRNAVLYPSEEYIKFGKATLLLDLLLVFTLCLLDGGTSSVIFFYLLIADCAIIYSPKFTGCFTFLCFAAVHLSAFIKDDSPELQVLLPKMGINSLSFLAVYVIMYIVKYEIRQRKTLSETMYELKLKSKQLENAYQKLKDNSEELEELTIVKERNRIAREIHDTVGHTLTTVLLEMEAGERLIPVDREEALEKLRLAKAQVRNGLQDIRESVKTLQSGKELMEFIPSLILLMEETKKHAGVFIKYEIKDLPKLTHSQEKAIYRALQEGLTNGIRHGKSTAFVFVLEYENGNIRFMLQDNGTGTDALVKGFGLGAMEERVKEAGGILKTQTAPGEGFKISITIPAEEEEKHGAE